MATKYDYWLCSIPGVGNHSIEKLLGVYDDAEQIYFGSEEDLGRLLRKSQLNELKKMRDSWDLTEEYNKMLSKQIHFIVRDDAEYPSRLKMIPDAPYGIFYKGRLPEERELSVAVIGARDCSEYGRYVAEELGSFLGKNKVQVVSGMARGIDGISQQATLCAGGTTTAVLGSGVDVCYPKQNRSLYDKILERGCILSSYPPGTMPRSGNFPPRNRIVSGLADVIVVIEARNKSGTLITVDMALEQGKEVYVVPGRITDRLSDGCNKLIKQGAGLLLSPDEFLQEIKELWERQGSVHKTLPCVERVQCKEKLQHAEMVQDAEAVRDAEKSKTMTRVNKTKGQGKENKVVEPEPPTGLPKELREVYEQLDFIPKSTDRILQGMAENINVSELNVRLMKLCLMGKALQESPGYFSRNR